MRDYRARVGAAPLASAVRCSGRNCADCGVGFSPSALSNTRDWQAEVAEAAYVGIDGDRVVIHNFRNFDYISKSELHPRWETKTVQLSNLRTVAVLPTSGDQSLSATPS
jgi:hypothetical protein